MENLSKSGEIILYEKLLSLHFYAQNITSNLPTFAINICSINIEFDTKF